MCRLFVRVTLARQDDEGAVEHNYEEEDMSEVPSSVYEVYDE